MTEEYFSPKVPTCCRRDRAEGRLSPGYCPAWCCDRGSGPSAAPLLASAGSVTFEEAASQRVAGMLQGQRGVVSLSFVFSTTLCSCESSTSLDFGHVSSLCNLSSSRQRDVAPLPSHSALALRSSAWLHIRYLRPDRVRGEGITNKCAITCRKLECCRHVYHCDKNKTNTQLDKALDVMSCLDMSSHDYYLKPRK